MKTIYQNPAYIAATAQLLELTKAQATAELEEITLLAQLGASTAPLPESALDRAKAMLSGKPAELRQDIAGLNISLGDARAKMALLRSAIHEQHSVMRALVVSQSVLVNANAKQAHIKAAEGIKAALASLRDAMATEQKIRNDIEAAGFDCHFEGLERADLLFLDSESMVVRFAANVDQYLMLHELRGEALVNVHLLVDINDGLINDVVQVSGVRAAELLWLHAGELTKNKPVRVARSARQSHEAALS